MQLRTCEQRFAGVQLGVVDDRLEELLQDAAECRSGLEPELDQLVAADGEIAEAVRARRLRLEQCGKSVQIGGRPALRLQVGTAERDQVEGDLVAVTEQVPPRVA